MNPVHCANCGDQVSRRGPTPASGRRYCMKSACQEAKYRTRDEERRPAYRNEWAPEVCSFCKTKLPKRKKLRSDSPAGRWCQRKACQEHRREAEARHGVEDAARKIEVLTDDGDFLRKLAAFATSVLEDCPECGGRGLTGWVHPNDADPKVPCRALGGRFIARATAALISPAFAEMVGSS